MLIAGRQFGFSLVEMMVAVVILGIMIAAALPSYRGWSENTQIRTAAESVLSGLQLARAEAARRNTNVSFAVNGNNWSVNVQAAGAASDAFYTPAATVQSRNGTEGTRHALITATQNAITFNGSGRVTPTPAASSVFAVTNPTGGACATSANLSGMRCLNVVVEPGGKIWMCDPALNGSGNPQACAP